MNRKRYSIFLSDEEIKALKIKSSTINIVGKGWLSIFIQTISLKDICFLDENLKKILSQFRLT